MPDLGPYEIRINHRMLLDLTLASIGLPKDVRQSAVKLFDEAAKFSCLPRLHPQQAAMTTSVGGDRGGNMSGQSGWRLYLVGALNQWSGHTSIICTQVLRRRRRTW